MSYPLYNGTNEISLEYPKYGVITFNLLNEDVAWRNTNHWSFCTSNKKCGIWVNVNKFPSDDMAKIIDESVDGGDGATLGSFKWYYTESD